ncbi:unnamed protein product (macronuclear) [Paramecium tetraurelia]|uniref:Transmembrane protein n=1 Tax=Paramecium tetraurelia TaxID=5888 RepID=A0BXJ0_PARTE|nr:uncharacterized protein GSPATT00033110001 [Paramecium tetraurelia]CAK63257.1 unnamed protein product [Paramecium tetraurelia]|eukprot:XP_001430655.1 hypothetical protein (macronuclear) [Paramecium tetraurelia strain d4-2]
MCYLPINILQKSIFRILVSQIYQLLQEFLLISFFLYYLILFRVEHHYHYHSSYSILEIKYFFPFFFNSLIININRSSSFLFFFSSVSAYICNYLKTRKISFSINQNFFSSSSLQFVNSSIPQNLKINITSNL